MIPDPVRATLSWELVDAETRRDSAANGIVRNLAGGLSWHSEPVRANRGALERAQRDIGIIKRALATLTEIDAETSG